MHDYLNWKEYSGILHHERADATADAFERRIMEARYGWAISRLLKHHVQTVLDVGCGLGYGANLISKAGFEVSGIDKSKKVIQIARSRYPHIDFATGEFPSVIKKEFDAIVGAEVIEHVSNYELFIKGCLRFIKAGGVLLLTTPNAKYTRQKNPHHYKEFLINDLKQLLPGSKIRAISTRLVWQKPLLLFISKEKLQRFILSFSRAPIVYHLPQYARYLALELKLEEKRI